MGAGCLRWYLNALGDLSTSGYTYYMDEDDERHGTRNGYNNLGCRCDKCRQAWAEYIRERRQGQRNHITTRKATSRRAAADRFWAKVEKAEGCWNWTGGKNMPAGYGVFWDGERYTGAHRFAYRLTSGDISEGMQVDHKCHNPACVNPDHLRATTPKQNTENRRGIRSDNTSGYQGVHWNKKERSWTARVTHRGRSHFLGYFSTREEANEAAMAKRNELFTHNDRDRRAA